ncbi:hypothetical protein Pth03_00910 [Planotetraspora thailandica]|uniref:Uncharacterized protein n=1 Tax=Planotetraspora thailandica TaxID=487172 RepID=A0A8J3UXK7_9ACTN|nr:hypothetical protein Pth03_00910 [Planotetraspora thailandica]
MATGTAEGEGTDTFKILCLTIQSHQYPRAEFTDISPYVDMNHLGRGNRSGWDDTP